MPFLEPTRAGQFAADAFILAGGTLGLILMVEAVIILGGVIAAIF